MGHVEAFQQYEDLHDHRKKIVGREARYSLLAYGFLRGRSYASMEGKALHEPNWSAVQDIAKRFSADQKTAGWEQWLGEAKAHIAQAEKAA